MLTAIAIDDEPKALEIIEIHAAKLPFLELKHSFRDALEAIAWLHEHPVDVVFLDINMPNLSGLKFRQLTGDGPMIIFTTAYSEYAVESYEQGAVDYLVKPIPFERFMKAALRAREWKTLKNETSPTTPPAGEEVISGKSIYVKTGTKFVRLRVEDIRYLQKDGNYIFFHTAGGQRVMSRLSTAQALELLPPETFLQVHKSYIVALPHIREVEAQQVTVGEAVIPVTKERWKELQERLGM